MRDIKIYKEAKYSKYLTIFYKNQALRRHQNSNFINVFNNFSEEVFGRLSSPSDEEIGDLKIVSYFLFVLTTLNEEKHVSNMINFIRTNENLKKNGHKILHQFHHRKTILMVANENFNIFITNKLIQFDKEIHKDGQSKEYAKLASLKCSRHQLPKKSKMIQTIREAVDDKKPEISEKNKLLIFL